MSNETTEAGDLPVKLELSARARASFELKGEIPKESMGRLIDTLNDMIRPFSERRGLKADLLRLQREEVLIEIAKKARLRAFEENLLLQPLPNKFMVPFLEKASTEEVDTELVDRWADLLLSASQNYSSRFLLYTNILSNLGPEDVKFLDRMVKENRGTVTASGYVPVLGDTPGLFRYEAIQEAFDDSFDEEFHTVKENMMDMIDKYEWPGIYFKYIEFIDHEDRHQDISREGHGYPHREQFSVSALESQGVIRTYECRSTANPLSSVNLCSITYLGVDFYRSCTTDTKVRTE